MPLVKNQIIANKYKIGKELGSGAFGTVYICNKVKKREDGRLVSASLQCVAKIIKVGTLEEETISLNTETRVLKSLNHPHLLKYYDSLFEEIDGDNFICIVTELCKLGDLDGYLKNQQKTNRINTVNDKYRIGAWLVQMTRALRYLHNKNVLHRDIKTKNIFLRASKIIRPNNHSQELPDLVLGDFGVAKILNDATCNRMASTFIGTPFYMSPEQLEQKPYTKSSDIWALGCVFYEMVELKRAIEARTLIQCLWQATNGETPKFQNQYFMDWQEILNGMMTKNYLFRSTSDDILSRLSYYHEEESRICEDQTVQSHFGDKDLVYTEPSDQFLTTQKSSSSSISKKSSKPRRTLKQTKVEKLPQPKITTTRSTTYDDENLVLSPKERLKMRKRQEADARARELINFHATSKKRQEIKSVSEAKKSQIFNKTAISGIFEHETSQTYVKPRENHRDSRQIKSAQPGVRTNHKQSKIPTRNRGNYNSYNQDFEEDTYRASFSNPGHNSNLQRPTQNQNFSREQSPYLTDENSDKGSYFEESSEKNYTGEDDDDSEEAEFANHTVIDKFNQTKTEEIFDNSIKPSDTVNDFASYLLDNLSDTEITQQSLIRKNKKRIASLNRNSDSSPSERHSKEDHNQPKLTFGNQTIKNQNDTCNNKNNNNNLLADDNQTNQQSSHYSDDFESSDEYHPTIAPLTMKSMTLADSTIRSHTVFNDSDVTFSVSPETKTIKRGPVQHSPRDKDRPVSSQQSQNSNSGLNFNKDNTSIDHTLAKPIDNKYLRVLDQLMIERIERLRQNCIDSLTEPIFYKVYEILKEMKSSVLDPSDNVSMDRLHEKLETLVPKFSDCMCVDQLLFLEEKAGFV